jgi:hypothetical protein
MQRWMTVFVAIAMVLGVTLPAIAQTELIGGGLTALPAVRLGPNLVTNGGFETVNGGLPASWSTGAGWAVDQLVTRQGSYSYRRTTGAPTASQAVFVRKGVYDFSAWIKTDNIAGSGNASMRLQFDMRPTLGAWTTTDPIKGTSDWTFYEIRNIVVPQDMTATLKLENFGNPGGTAWFDDVKLTQKLEDPIQVYMLYPNFRGMMFDDQGTTLRFEVKTTPPPGTDPGSLTITGRLKEEASGRVIATRAYTGAGKFEATLDGSLMQPGQAYLAEFSVNTSPAYTYPAYRVSRVPASARRSMNIAFDAENRMLVRGTPRFLLGVYDSGGGYSSAESFWEQQIFSPTGPRRLDGLRINFYLNYWMGTAAADAMKALMSTLQKRGAMYLQTGNCFDKYPAGPEFSINNSDDYVRDIGSHPGSGGYYTIDECRSAMVEGAFAQYTRLRRLDPDSMTFSALFGNPELELWKDAADVIATDPYPMWGAEPAAGYEHKKVADWTAQAREVVRESRPVMAVLQFLKATSLGRWPTRQEMRNHAYMAIVEGAKGLWWWSAGNGLGALHNAACVPVEAWCAYKVELLDNLKAVVAELADLEPVLLASDAPGALRGNSSPSAIRTMAKVVDGKGYVFAYNYTNAPVTATLTWNTVPGTVTVHKEGRTLTPSGASFTDTFGPYQAHVYFLGHGGVPGTPPEPPVPQAPTITFVNPAAGASVSATVTVTMAASGGSGSGYTYRATVDGAQVYAGTNPTFSWNTTTVANGSRTLTATVTDSAGTASAAATRAVTVANTAPPSPLTVAFTSPAAGATVSGTVSVAMAASGGSGSGYTYRAMVDGAAVYTGPGAAFSWNTTAVADGGRTLTVTVTDSAGAVSAMATRAVTVANTPTPPGTDSLKLEITYPKPGATVTGAPVAVLWLSGTTSTSNTFVVMLDGVEVGRTTTANRGPVAVGFDTRKAPNGQQTLVARATDAAGKTGTVQLGVTVANADTPPPAPAPAPTVTFVTPGAGATVKGAVTVTLAATGGAAAGAGSGSAYSYKVTVGGTTVYSGISPTFTWNTMTVANTAHTLVATVIDAAGTSSAPVTRNVVVANPVTPLPVEVLNVVLTAPRAGAIVRGTGLLVAWLQGTTSTANSYTVTLDGVQVAKVTGGRGPVTIGWNTKAIANGARTLTVTVRDAAGRTATTSLPVNVRN